MITTKELQYVDHWANRIPMPGKEYSIQIMNEIEECYNLYNSTYKDKEYDFIFSNGEEIGFEILSKNLCHMLGIDHSNIKGDFFNKYRTEVFGTSNADFTSYDLVELLIENKEKVVDYDNDINNRAKAINYYKSGIKCSIFKKLSDFDKFNFAAINYDPEDKRFDYDKQKMFFIPSNESVCPYFMVGIRLNSDVTVENTIPKYIVTSLLAPREPKNFFENQEVIIPTQILVSDNDTLTRLIATPNEKIQLLTMYKNIINTYGIPNRKNINSDYESMLNEQNNQQKIMKK